MLEVARRPKGIKLLKSKYVYKQNHNKEGTIKKFKKAGLVALGYREVPGLDVSNTYTPVCRQR